MEREEKVLKALANKKRLMILRMLQASTAGINVQEIAKKIKVSKAAASNHLSKLEAVGLIKKNRKGMFIISNIPPAIEEILNILNKLFYRRSK